VLEELLERLEDVDEPPWPQIREALLGDHRERTRAYPALGDRRKKS
jgi:hypothetical protein